MPNFYIIAGCNGAGKTTASFNILPRILHCDEFVNADEIARGISPFHPAGAAIQAGKIMLNRIDELLEKGVDFAIETTLTTYSYQHTIRIAQSKGYVVTLLFFWLNSEELAIDRVKQRVSEGGHNIPEATIRRRYHRGIDYLFRFFLDICDNYIVVDNSNHEHELIARKSSKGVEVKNKRLFELIKSKANGN
ncbi:MAG: zeta toxin family protein [Fluviicola sp.]|nr:zeta toxin family protein [Fluviicola sp.]